MEVIGGWISNVVIFLIAAFLLELLLPSSSLQKYTRLVLSFILMLIIIEPILQLTNQDYKTEWGKWNELHMSSYELDDIKTEINMQKNEIEKGQDAYISEQVTEHLESQTAETVRERWGWEVKNLDLQWEDEEDKNIEDVVVTVQLAPVEEGDQRSIESVDIQMEQEDENHAPLENRKEIITFLGDSWGVSSEQIHLEMAEEGGF